MASPRPKKRPGPRRLRTTKQVAEALRASYGMVEIAARQLKIHGRTLRGYLADSPELREICQAERECLKDRAELRLIKLINDGNLGAICFFLKTQAKDRGYVERQEVTGREGRALLPEQFLQEMTDSEFAFIEALFARVEQAPPDRWLSEPVPPRLADDTGA